MSSGTRCGAWIEESGVLDHRTEPSVPEAWTVHELVTHVGRSSLDLTVLGPETRTAPLALGDYVAGYGASAQEVADGTKQLARSFEANLLGGIDNCARLDDFVATRIIELVREVRATAYTDTVDRPPRVDDELTWIRLATGRLPSDDPALPLP
ncbi:MAG: hypothetical protein ABWX71_02995 [Aeromicrobium sp.]